MSLNEYIGMGIFVVAIIGLVIRISHVLNKKVSYESLDRCKKDVTDTFVSKDVFSITVNTFKEDITEIKKDVKQLLRKANGK